MKFIGFAFLFVLPLLFGACVDHESENAKLRERLIKEGIEIKVSDFRQREWEKCLAQARTTAIAKADSIIRALAKEEAIEPVSKPPKPEKPEKPSTRVLPDSIKSKVQSQDTLIKK